MNESQQIGLSSQRHLGIMFYPKTGEISLDKTVIDYSLKTIALSAIWGSFPGIGAGRLISACFSSQTRILTIVGTLFGSLIGGFVGYHQKETRTIKETQKIPSEEESYKKNHKITAAFFDRFAHLIIQTFDEIKRKENVFSPNDSPDKTVSAQPNQFYIKTKEDPEETPGSFRDLPAVIKNIIVEYSADMSSWFAMTNFFSPQNRDQELIQASISNRLEALIPKTNHTFFKERRLLMHIFKEVFIKTDDKKLESIFSFSDSLQPISGKIYSISSRIVIGIYTILNNPISRVCLFVISCLGHIFFFARMDIFLYPHFFDLFSSQPLAVSANVIPIFYRLSRLYFSWKTYTLLKKSINEMANVFIKINGMHKTKKKEYLLGRTKRAYELWMSRIKLDVGL